MLSGCVRATTENSSNCNNTSQPTVTCQSRIKKSRGIDLAVEYKKSFKRSDLPGEQLLNLLSCLFPSLSANIMERIPPSKCLISFGVLSGYTPTSFWTSRAQVTKPWDLAARYISSTYKKLPTPRFPEISGEGIIQESAKLGTFTNGKIYATISYAKRATVLIL